MDEKASGRRIHRSIKCFNNFIENCGLFDLPLVGGKFTWANSRASMRIDRVLVSEAWIERFWNPKQVRGSRVTWNHWPLMLTNGRLNCGLVPSHFENMWLDLSSFKGK